MAVQLGHLVGCGAVAGLAGGGILLRLAAHVGARLVIDGSGRVPAAGHFVAGGFVAFAATEVQAVLVHVHVQVLAGHIQGAVQVAMLHRVTTAAEEVARTTVFTPGLAHALGHDLEVGGLHDLAGLGRELHVLVGRVTRQAGQLAVGAGALMANQAIDVILRCEVELLVLPAIAGMARSAELVVGGHGRTEVVDDVFLAQTLAGLRVQEFPSPVLGLVHLLGGFSVTDQTGLGDLRPALEVLLQFLELAVVRGG